MFTFLGSLLNFFEKDPAVAALNSPYFDVIGRYFTLGVRANF
jgi:iron complex outermembrane receptor protein